MLYRKRTELEREHATTHICIDGEIQCCVRCYFYKFTPYVYVPYSGEAHFNFAFFAHHAKTLNLRFACCYVHVMHAGCL